MKKLLLLAVCSIFFATSCTQIYNPKVLQGYYDLRMNSKEELEIKSKVRIFLSDTEVQGDYEVISLNLYKPFTIPVLVSMKGQMRKKFFEKAVKKAYEQGGNGIIVTAAGYYKVINLVNWDSDSAAPDKFVNAILDVTLLNRFKSGEIAKLSPREVKRFVTDLDNEVKFNLKTMKTSEEAKVVKEKIVALQSWNSSQAKPNSRLTKKVEAYLEAHISLAKRIARKEAKAVEQAKLAAEQEALAKAKAEEQARLAAEQEALAKAKAEERARLAAEREALAKAQAEEQSKLAAEREALAKAKAEEQGRLAAEQEALAKAKAEERLVKCIDKNIHSLQHLKIDTPTSSYVELGDNYFYGKNGTEFNPAKAFLCYNMGAKQGEAESYNRLAQLYKTGAIVGDKIIESNAKLSQLFSNKAIALQK